MRFGPAVAAVLYLLLVLSAALALWVQQAPGALPPQLSRTAPWVFLVFVVAFAVYRYAMVRANRYPAFKAFFQVGTAILFFTLLLPKARDRYQTPDELIALMQDSNPNVRALAAEVARHRDGADKYGGLLSQLLSDPDEEVRRQAHQSLVKIGGSDLGAPADPQAVKAWRERFK